MKTNNENDILIESLSDRDEIIQSIIDEFKDEDIQSIMNKFKKVDQYKRDVMFLYAKYGATKASDILGLSRGYIYKIVKDLREELL